MADDFAARQCDKYTVVCLVPDFCHPGPLPYPAVIDLSESANPSPNVNYNSNAAFLHEQSDTVKVDGDQPGIGLGILSLSIEGKCEPITSSTILMVNGKQQTRENDYYKMNIGEEDVANTVGQLVCTEMGGAKITAEGKMAEMSALPDDESFFDKIENAWDNAGLDTPLQTAEKVIEAVAEELLPIQESKEGLQAGKDAVAAVSSGDMGGIATGAVALGSTAVSAVYNKTAGKITPDVLEKKLGDFIKTLKAKLGGGKSKGKGKDKKEDCKKCKPGGKKPVIFTGAKILADAQELDFSINAPMPLVWQRSYASDNPREGLLGQGWTLLSDSHLIIKPEQIIFAEPNGRGLEFEALDVGESDYWPVEQLTVSRPEKEQYQVSTGDGTVLTFSPSQIAGKYLLSHMQDINGNGLRYRYNHYQQPGEEDLLTHIKTDDDRIFALSYLNTKDQLRLQSVEEWVWQENDPDRKENFQKRPLVNYSYSEQGDLIQVRNHLDRITREFEYKNHIMVAHKVPNGLESYYSYDFYTDKGKVQKNHTNNGESWTFDYTQPQQTTITDQTGRQTTYQFDKDKYLTGTIDALGQQHQLELDDDGLPEKVINEAGQEKSFVYDKRGNALLIKDIDGNTTQVSYHDEFNVPVEISDDFGNTTTLEYDDKANLIKETDPDGATTTYERDKHGQPIAITGAKGNRNTLKYDRAGNMVARTDCSGNSTLYHYDRDSNLTGITDALKQHTTYGYDAEHRLINIHYPDDSKEKFEYNPLGQLIAYTDPKGNSTQYELDKEGRPTKRINSLGGELGYQYDNHGRLTSLINENKAEYKFAYDPLDRLIHEQGIDGLTTGYQYDPVGNVTEKREDEKGEEQRTTKFIRDNAGRLQEKHIARGKLKSRTRYQYDDLGQLSQARNEHSRIDLAYDAMGRLKAETTATKNGEHTVSHSYDSLGNRIQTELPSGKKLNWLYYGSGHLHQINVDGELISDYERDALHREINRTQGNLLSTQSYDPLGRILQQQTLRQNQIQQHDKDSIAPALNGQRQGQQRQGINNKTNNPIQIQRDYQYDQSGELTQLKDLRNGTTSYKYDKLGRITNTQQPGNKETFAFDPAHNLIAKGDEAIKDNRLKVFEDKRYQYDTFGNMTEKKIGKHTKMAFSYDAEHQMKTVEISKNGIKQSYQYAYDPFGRRISKTDSFNTTHFIWDGNRLLSETRGSQTKTYVYEQDGFVPVAQLDEQGIQYYHTDHLGTPRELTDTAGNITWEATYQTWGNTLKVSYQQVQSETENELAPAIQPLRFQGQYFDEETGLHYNRFRYFDPDVGRFVCQDPIGLLGGDNFYQYSPNPIGWIDPLGLARGAGNCTCSDDCERLYKKIAKKSKGTKATSGARGLEERIEHLREDKADLYNKAKTKSDKHTIGPLAGMGTWEGHVDAATELKEGLNSDIQKYNTSGCNSKHKKLPSSFKKVAEMEIPNKPGY